MFVELALIGTTASGKSALANALASEFSAYLLSLDSLCVYKQINIASAKPSEKELSVHEYFGVNLLDVDEAFNVSLFFSEYERAKAAAKAANKPLIIVGGTSFYLSALMNGLSEIERKPRYNEGLSAERGNLKDLENSANSINLKNLENVENLKNSANLEDLKRQAAASFDKKATYALMREVDKDSKIHANDTYRLQKWLELYALCKPMAPSEFLRQSVKKAPIASLEIFELEVDKELLREKIAARTKEMLKKGLLDEAASLFARYDEGLKPLKSIGLKECGAFLRGEIDRNELENLINTHTAQLAKRQRTFNKKFQSVKLSSDEAFYKISKFLREKI